MTELEIEHELALIEKCDKESHEESTDRIRVVDKENNWNNSSIDYFMYSLGTDEKVLLKNFIHVDTYCRLGCTPQQWRVQGFLCLGDLLDYLEQSYKEKEFRQLALQNLLKTIVFDNQYDEMVRIRYKNHTYLKILEYDATHRVL